MHFQRVQKSVCPYTTVEVSATESQEGVRQAQAGREKRHIHSKFIILCVYTVVIDFLSGLDFSLFWKQHPIFFWWTQSPPLSVSLVWVELIIPPASGMKFDPETGKVANFISFTMMVGPGGGRWSKTAQEDSIPGLLLELLRTKMSYR